MGSLGLEYLTGMCWNSSDIDIHVEGDPRGWEASDEDRIYHRDRIFEVMQGLSYELVDLHEHEFRKDGISVEFGTINSLPEFAGVDLGELRLMKEEYQQRESTTVNHFYEKLFTLKDKMNTQTAKEIAEHRHKVMEKFIDEFLREW